MHDKEAFESIIVSLEGKETKYLFSIELIEMVSLPEDYLMHFKWSPLWSFEMKNAQSDGKKKHFLMRIWIDARIILNFGRRKRKIEYFTLQLFEACKRSENNEPFSKESFLYLFDSSFSLTTHFESRQVWNP